MWFWIHFTNITHFQYLNHFWKVIARFGFENLHPIMERTMRSKGQSSDLDSLQMLLADMSQRVTVVVLNIHLNRVSKRQAKAYITGHWDQWQRNVVPPAGSAHMAGENLGWWKERQELTPRRLSLYTQPLLKEGRWCHLAFHLKWKWKCIHVSQKEESIKNTRHKPK